MATAFDPVAHLRFMATVKRQSAPPRCNPFAIVIQVLALGMIFIGLTMTIIANWPGATTIGENPLKIAGPVLIAVGVTAFLVGIIVVCVLNKREGRRWEKTIARIAASKPVLQSQLGADKCETAVPTGAGIPQDVRRSAAPVGQPHTDVSADTDWSNDQSFEPNDAVPDAVRVKKPRPPRHKKPTTTTDCATTSITTQHHVLEETVVHSKPPPSTAVASYPGSSEEARSLLHEEKPSSSPAEASKRLHVHVKALPGATVRIQQGSARPAVAPKPAFAAHNQLNTSAETDI